MTALKQCRDDFCAKMTTFVPQSEERERFAKVIDDFIGWSLKHPDTVQHAVDHEQNVVAFKRTSDGAVLWTACPKRYDGAKFEILPGKSSSLGAELREEVLSVMQPLAEDPDVVKPKFLASFLKLKRAETRQRVMGLMDRLIAV